MLRVLNTSVIVIVTSLTVLLGKICLIEGGVISNAPNITRIAWKTFFALVNNVFQIEDKILVSDVDNLFLRLENISGVRVEKCREIVKTNPNCQSRLSVKLVCPFSCKNLDAGAYQHRPLFLGSLSVMLENKEFLSFRGIDGHISGEMQGCCLFQWQESTIYAPYVYAIVVDSVNSSSISKNSDVTISEKKTLLDLLNTYFSIYLREYLYSPAC